MDNKYFQLRGEVGGAVSRYVDQLDKDGQIDRDDNSDPSVLGFEKIPGSNLVRLQIARNGVQQSVVMNPRSRNMKPERQSFDVSDNWKREDQAPKPVVSSAPAAPLSQNPGGERMKRASQNVSSGAGAAPEKNMNTPQPQPWPDQASRLRKESYVAALTKFLG